MQVATVNSRCLTLLIRDSVPCKPGRVVLQIYRIHIEVVLNPSSGVFIDIRGKAQTMSNLVYDDIRQIDIVSGIAVQPEVPVNTDQTAVVVVDRTVKGRAKIRIGWR